jgi:phytanoyl-CoA hydroxylase
MFEELWIDRPDTVQRLNELEGQGVPSDLLDALQCFTEQGFCILRQAVTHEDIAAYLRDFDRLVAEDPKLLASYGRDTAAARDMDIRRPLTKILDVHARVRSATSLALAPGLTRFLDVLFGEEALAFQSLHFEVGSTQAVHQDTAYVVVDEPLSLCASWIALEDIQLGSGELVYYPGSHRFGQFLYGEGRRHWSPDQDGGPIHDHHLAWLHQQASERQVKLQSFLPQKGDVLFWHADLAHGGGAITDPSATRRSLVVHYCPTRCTPYYMQFLEPRRQKRLRLEDGGQISTFYYDLDGLAEPSPPLQTVGD